MTTKPCRICGIEKSLDEYYRNAATCRKCTNKKNWANQKVVVVAIKNYVGREKDPNLLRLREARVEELARYYEMIPRSCHTVLAKAVDEKLAQIKGIENGYD